MMWTSNKFDRVNNWKPFPDLKSSADMLKIDDIIYITDLSSCIKYDSIYPYQCFDCWEPGCNVYNDALCRIGNYVMIVPNYNYLTNDYSTEEYNDWGKEDWSYSGLVSTKGSFNMTPGEYEKLRAIVPEFEPIERIPVLSPGLLSLLFKWECPDEIFLDKRPPFSNFETKYISGKSDKEILEIKNSIYDLLNKLENCDAYYIEKIKNENLMEVNLYCNDKKTEWIPYCISDDFWKNKSLILGNVFKIVLS